MCIWCKVKTSVVLEIHNKIEMKRTVKYKLGKGFTFNIRVKPFLHCKGFKFCFKILNSL